VGVAEPSVVTDAGEIVDRPPTVAPGEGPRPVVGAPGFWDRPERWSLADRAQPKIDPIRAREEEPIARSDKNLEARRQHVPCPHQRESRRTPSNDTRTCNKLPGVYM
jgi:hypothetical protein